MADIQATICDMKGCANVARVTVVHTSENGAAKRKDYCGVHVGQAVKWLHKFSKKVHE